MSLDFPDFDKNDYAALADRVLAEPTEAGSRVESALRWLVDTKAGRPWTDDDFRTASAALIVAASKAGWGYEYVAIDEGEDPDERARDGIYSDWNDVHKDGGTVLRRKVWRGAWEPDDD